MLEHLTDLKSIRQKIAELYQIGEDTAEIWTHDGRAIRVTARKVIFAINSKYSATYEQLVRVPINGKDHEVWAKASFPFARGENVEQCLLSAISFIAERSKPLADDD